MVILRPVRAGASAFLNAELVVAMAILVIAVFPLSAAFLRELKLARIYYQEAVAMEILDGEMEILAAGEWRSYAPGEYEMNPSCRAATNLPPGKFIIVRKPQVVRIEWRPSKHGRPMFREVKLP